MSSNNVGYLFTKTIITLQQFATLHHISLNYTSPHLSTLHFLSFTLHYSLIWLNPLTFPIVLFHPTSLNQTQYSAHLQTYFQNNEPLHCPKEPLIISRHVSSLFFFLTYQETPLMKIHRLCRVNEPGNSLVYLDQYNVHGNFNLRTFLHCGQSEGCHLVFKEAFCNNRPGLSCKKERALVPF